MNLFKKLVISFLFISLVPLFFVFLLSNLNFKDSLLSTQQKALETITHIKIQVINDYFDIWENKIIVEKNFDIIKNSLPVIFNSENNSKNTKFKLIGQSLDEEVDNFIKEHNDLENVFFTDQNGIIVYSYEKEFKNQSFYKISPIFSELIYKNKTKDIFISNIFNDLRHSNYNSNLDFFISSPIFNSSNIFSGFIIFHINTNELFNLVGDNSGLGVSGETLIARIMTQEDDFLLDRLHSGDNKKHILVINPKHISGKEKIITERIIHIGDKYGIPLQQAVQGIGGEGKSIDYKGKKVLAVWNYLPKYNLGIVTKIDLDELLIPVKIIIKEIIIFCLISFLGIFIIVLFLSRTISLPILKLSNAVEKFKRGNFDTKVEILSEDEIGNLSRAFNLMAVSIKESQSLVFKKVEEQTGEIKTKAEELESQKIAILNILDDVENGKKEVERLANDLKKFKLAVENVSDQIVITDPEGIVVFANKATEEITGFYLKDILDKKIGVLWKTPMPVEFYKKMWDFIKNQKKNFIGEIQNKRKNGEIYTAMISVSPIMDKNDKIIFFVGIERDISKEKEVDKAKTEFVSIASHQLRTPLSAINWYTEMLLDGDAGKLNEEQEKYVKEVYAGSKRMVSLVSALLNVSRLDLGTFFIEPKPVNVIEIIKDVLNELKVKILARKLIVKESYEENIPEFQADKGLLRIVFQNLLSNSVKYTRENGNVGVSVSIVSKDKSFGGKNMETDSFCFSVSDSGIGVPFIQQDKMFSKLFRADNARQTETEGTGLGLYILESIIKKSGGQVWFESVENKGTTFYISFSLSGMKKKGGDKKLD